jgi:hypothetical protein
MRAGPRGPSADGIRPSRALIARQARNPHERPDFDGARACPWNLCSGVEGLAAILDVGRELAAELFTRLRERPVGDEHFAAAHPGAGRRRLRV